MDKREYTYEVLRILLGGDNTPDYTEQEKAARNKQAPMTQELFASCLNRCAEAGNIPEFFDLFDDFPGCGEIWCDQLEKEMEGLDIHLEARKKIKMPTNEERQARWLALRERIRKKYGDEIADNLVENIQSL